MRICLYTDSALPKMGPQELAVDALARAYAELGHQPIVLAPWPKSGMPSADPVPYPVLRHPCFYSMHLLTSWNRGFLQNNYRQHPFDVLHCHGVYPTSYLAALSRTIIPTPVVVTGHGADIDQTNARLKSPTIVERMTLGLQSADALVATNPYTRERLTQLCPDAAARIVDIPNGVHLPDASERIPRPAGLNAGIVPGAYALYIGRLKYRNGVDVLLQALARTPENGNVQLVLAGDGDERALLEIFAEQLDLQSRIRFLGNVTNPVKRYLLQNARFGVVSARQPEASESAVLEGYAAGLPMIATDLPAWSNLIQPGKTGLLVRPESPEDLADAMTRLFADDALVQRMSAHALAFVKPFHWQVIAERHLSLYRSLRPRQISMAA